MLKYGVALACVALLSACGATDTGNDNNGSNGGSDGVITTPGNGNTSGNDQGGQSSTITGIWGAQIDYEEDGIDEFYFAFSASGRVSIYDYMGDSYDRDDNCYVTNANFGQVAARENGIYRITYEAEDGTYALDLRLDNNQLLLVEDGETYHFLTRTTLQSSDMQPSCEF